jgi:Bacterial Ig-like domain (group 3)
VIVAVLAGPAYADTPLLIDNFNPSTASASGNGSFNKNIGQLKVSGQGQTSTAGEETLTYNFSSPEDLTGSGQLTQLEIDFSSIVGAPNSASLAVQVTLTDSNGNTSSGSTGTGDSGGVRGSFNFEFNTPVTGISGSANLAKISTLAITFDAFNDNSNSFTVNLTAIGADKSGDNLLGGGNPPPPPPTVSQVAVSGTTSPTYGQSATYDIAAEDSNGDTVASDNDAFSTSISAGSISSNDQLSSGTGSLDATFTSTGSQSITVTDNGVQGTINVDVQKASQQVSFPQPAAGTVNGFDSLSATAPGGTVSFSVDTTNSSPSDACSIDSNNANQVDFNHAGTCAVTGTQAGGSDYTKASTTDLITVGKDSQAVSFPQPSAGTVGGTELVSATAPGGTVTFSVDTTNSSPSDACSIDSNNADEVDFNHAGSCVIVAAQAGDSDYNSASTEQTISVGQGAQSISFSQPAAGAVNGSDSLSATAPGGTVSFSVVAGDSSPSDACSIDSNNANQVDFNHAGTCAVMAAQAGDGDYLPASTEDTITVGKASQLVTFPQPASGSVGGSDQLSGSAPGGAVTFSVDTSTSTPSDACSIDSKSADTVDFAHAGSCVVTASQAGDSDYVSASSFDTITVGKATPSVVLSVTPSSGATVKSAVTLTATVVGVAGGPTPGGTVDISVGGGSISGCSGVALSGGSATCALGALPAGSYSFTASYGGSSDYTSGSPNVVSGLTVSKLPTAGGVVLPASAIVYGQAATAADAFTSGGGPVSGGTVQWSTDSNSLGTAEAVDSNGAVVSPSLAGLSVGTHVLTAAYSGTSTFQSYLQSLNIVVGKASTATSVAVTHVQLSASVAVVKPGAGTPTGTVAFYKGGSKIGTAPVSSAGLATFTYKSSGAESISAAYSGDLSFNASSASTATHNPKITYRLSSRAHRTAYGWYDAPVTVHFRCTAGSSELRGKCPGAVTLSKSRGAQSVTRTIHSADGGVATVNTAPINIDLRAPKIKLSSTRIASQALSPLHALSCRAHAGISGLAHGCVIKLVKRGIIVDYRATAISKAGKRTTITGHYQSMSYYVSGVSTHDGSFIMHAGHTYTVVAYLPGVSHPPVLYSFAAPDGVSPGPGNAEMQPLGHGLWAIRVLITAQMLHSSSWTLGVNVNGTLHKISIIVKP